jgi:hypothetical protein
MRPQRPSPVALHQQKAPEDLKLGVLVSLTSKPGEGAEWVEAAEGARVAAHRYAEGDLDITLLPVDDKGTAKGAAAGVRHLVEKGVTGIVVATAGDHVRAAVAAAASHDVPVLLPYETESATLPANAWVTGPDAEQVGSALARALAAKHLERPALLDVGGGTPPGLEPVTTARLAPGGSPARAVARLKRLQGSDDAPDSVVVSGPAAAQSEVVKALQGRQVGFPVHLTPQVLSPVFDAGLAEGGASMAEDLTTVGQDTDDLAALDRDAPGQALSAFFEALRGAAGEPRLKDFFDGQPFATVADAADTRSHDAVVALVVAAARARSADPGEVLEELGGLELDHADGLAGPALDFTRRQPLADRDVVTLHSSDRDPGLRPRTPRPEPHLFWFAAPTD